MDFGLLQGVRNFISRIKSLRAIEISFDTNLHDERFDNNIEVVAYRVVCELINNSLKHSGCSKIEVELMLEEHTLELKYKDNGCGFTLGAPSATGGMGLSNITSRIKSLNGTFSITSAEGEGMQAVVQIAIKSEDVNSNKEEKPWKKR